MFTKEDLLQIEERGASLSVIEEQIDRFKKGFPAMKIVGAAVPGRGIKRLSDSEAASAADYYQKAEIKGKCKFVPASGAASRMFKDMFAALEKLQAGEDLASDSPGSKLAARISDFAFYDPDLFGKSEDCAAYRKATLSKMLGEPGLGYGSKPKGVLKFHRYPSEVRTAFAEHLVEAQEYMRSEGDVCSLVFTISPEHRELFENALAEVRSDYEKRYGVKYDINFTYQDKATDTIAVDMANEPFRTEDGRLLFRPAGHGALIYNLNKVDRELVSIKNIDNVAHEKLLPVTSHYKKVLMGEALKLRDRIFSYLRKLDSEPSDAMCDEIEAFLDNELCVKMPPASDRVKALHDKLNRPIRVCGMVRNEGEPGGGPYIVEGRNGSTSLQILESVQINKDDPAAMDAMNHATHFNPVDLVCLLYDYKGGHFDLLKRVDPDAGFMSSKSYQGRELKALEMPGLWNGAMSDWNTIFVEVPVETFNPVKVVLDLLRPAHQA